MAVDFLSFTNSLQGMMFIDNSGIIINEILLNVFFQNTYFPKKFYPTVNTYNQDKDSCPGYNKQLNLTH